MLSPIGFERVNKWQLDFNNSFLLPKDKRKEGEKKKNNERTKHELRVKTGSNERKVNERRLQNREVRMQGYERRNCVKGEDIGI